VIYVLEAVGADALKIGFAGTADGARKRVLGMQVGNHCELRIVRTLPGDRAAEKALHRLCAPHRIRGEWFRRAALALLPEGEIALDMRYVLHCTQCGAMRRRRHQRLHDSGLCRACAHPKSAPPLPPEHCQCGRALGRKSGYPLGTPRVCRGCAMRAAWADPEYKQLREAARLRTLHAKKLAKRAAICDDTVAGVSMALGSPPTNRPTPKITAVSN
jgi:hypothetical protein